MRVAGINATAGEIPCPVGRYEAVGRLSFKMPTFHQDESAFRLFNHLPRRGNTFRAAREHLQLRYVGRYQRAERHQFLLQNLYCLFVEQAVARRRNHDRVEDNGGRMIGFDETRDGAYDVAVHRHSDFQSINSDVVENRRRLLVNRLCVNGNRFFDPRGVLHRQRRDARWINHEAPYHAERTLEALSAETGAVLFDCLTVYMCNLIYGKEAPEGEFLERCQVVFDEIDKVLAAARNCGKIVVFVTNEVGSGIVPDNQMAREYRDLAGWVNQRVAKEADHVYYCVAGQAVDVKKLAFKFEDEGE
mgnify:CR=1 FL=1